MKNLMIYVNPSGYFGEEEKITVKIQIDNSLDLGWRKEDILLVTNFPYEYNGIKAVTVSSDNYCPFWPQASKIKTITDLFEKGLIEQGKLYWFHDLDAFQSSNITESELELDGVDVLLPDWGRIPRWATGSIFFKDSAEDIFSWIRDIIYKYKIDEERAFQILTGHDSPIDRAEAVWVKGYSSEDMPEIKNINKRIKKANITYNFHSFNVRSNYAAAFKPIKVVHFHCLKRQVNPANPRPNQIDFFLRGINKIGVQIVPEKLVNIFNRHGII